MAQQTPVLNFREGLDADWKFVLHAAAHFHAARVQVGHYRKWRRTERFLLSLVLDGLRDYINAGKSLRMHTVEVYRAFKFASY